MSGTGGSTEAGVSTLRWVAFVTGYTPNDDYAPIESEGVSPDLLAEVKDVCVAFHPHNEIRLFPTRYPAYLFWCARATGEYVITRVSLDERSAGVRKSLEYLSLLLPPDEFARLGNDPFRTKALALHDRVRERLTAADRAPVDSESPPGLDPAAHDARLTQSESSSTLPRFLSGGDHAPTIENLREMEVYCRQTGLAGGMPLTFATWWESGKGLPEGYFEIVLRVRPPQHSAMTLNGAEDAIVSLAADIQTALPREGLDWENERLHRELGGLVSGLIAVLRSAEHLTGEEFRRAMADGADRIHSIGGKIQSISQASPVEMAAHLDGLARRCEQCAADLPRLSHPRLPVGWRGKEAATASGRNSQGTVETRPPSPWTPLAPATPAAGVAARPAVTTRARHSRRTRGGAGGAVGITAGIAILLAGAGWFWHRNASGTEPAPILSVVFPSAASRGRPDREATAGGVSPGGDAGSDDAVGWILSHTRDDAVGPDGMTLAFLADGCRQILNGPYGAILSAGADAPAKGQEHHGQSPPDSAAE